MVTTYFVGSFDRTWPKEKVIAYLSDAYPIEVAKAMADRWCI